MGKRELLQEHAMPTQHVACAGACLPVLLSHWGKKSGAPGGRSLAYVLGNMLSAGGEGLLTSSPLTSV